MQRNWFLALISALTMILVPSALLADITKLQKVTQSNGQELTLNGMGMWKRAGNDMFIAALYLPSPSGDVNAINYEKIPKRVEIRVVEDSIHKASFMQMWREYISINTPRENRSKINKDILGFIKSFKGKLLKGDRLIIDFLPGSGVYVLLNGNQINRIENDKLAEVIVNALVGERPITPEFKKGLLGGNSTKVSIQLTQTFAGLEPDSQRIAQTRSWR